MGAGLAALVVVAWIVHSPAVTRAVLTRVQQFLLARYQLQLTADRLDYNLVTRRVRADGLRLAASGHEAEPFFVAAHAEAALSWRVYLGTVALTDLSVDGGRVHLATDVHGRSNLLPGSGAPPPSSPRRLDVRALHVRGLDVVYADAQDDVEVTVRGVEAEWTPRAPGDWPGMAGRLAITGGTEIRFGAERTTAGPSAGEAEFDGSTIRVRGLGLPLPEGAVVIGGPVTRVFDDTQLDLAFRGDVDIAAAAHWVAPPMAVGGRATVTGRIAGPIARSTLTADWSSVSAQAGLASDLRVEAEMQVTADALALPSFTIETPDGGTATGRLRSGFGRDAWLEAHVSWQHVDLDTALALAEMEVWPAAAVLDGTMTARQGPGDDGPASVRVRTTSRPIRRARRAPAAGTLVWQYDGGHWTATHAHQLLGSISVRGSNDGDARDRPFAESTLRGPLTVDVADADTALRAARAAGFAVPVVASLRGGLRLETETSGVLGDPSLAGTVAGASLRIGDAALDVSSTVRVTPSTLSLEGLDVRTAGASLRMAVTVDRASEQLRGSIDAQVDDIGPLVAGLHVTPAAQGHGALHAQLSGTSTRPVAAFTADAGDVTVAGQSATRVTARGQLTATALQLDRAELHQDSGHLVATGAYDWERGRVDLRAEGAGLRWAAPFGAGEGRPVAALIETLEVDSRGDTTRPVATGTATVRLEGGRAAALAGEATVALAASAGRAQLQIAAPALALDGRVELDTRAPYAYRAHLEAPRLSLDALAALAGIGAGAVSGEAQLAADATGALAGEARADGPTDARLTLRALAGTAGGVAVRLERPVDLVWTGAGVTLGPLAAAVGTGRFEAAGRAASVQDGAWEAAFDGQLGDVLAMSRAMGVGAPAGVAATGRVRARLATRNGLDGAHGELTVTDGRVQAASLPAMTAVEVTASLADRAVEVSALRGRWQGATLEGTAQLPLALLTGSATAAPVTPTTPGARLTPGTPGTPPSQGRLQLALTGVTTEALAPWLDAAQRARLSGRASATLEAAITGPTVTDLRGHIGIEAAPWQVGGVPVEQRRPFRLGLADGQLTFDDVHWLVGGSALDVTGGLTIAGREAGALDARVAGAVDLRMLSALMPGVASDGTAQVDMRIAGTTAAPRFGGTVMLEDAELLLREPRVVVSELRGPLQLDGSVIRMPELTGTINGGRLTVAGQVQLEGAVPRGGEVLAQLQGAVFEPTRGVQGEIDALLRFTPDPVAPRLGGDVLVQRSAYRANLSIPALLRRARARTRPWQSATLSDRLQLDVAVGSVEDLSIDNNYGRMSAGLDLRVQGTPSRPGLTGRVTLREGGQAYLLGRTYRLESSSLTFINPSGITPELDITTLAQVRGRTVTLHLTGPLERLETSVQSSDASETPESLAGVLIGQDVSGEDALALLSAEILGTTGRALGLDTLRLEQGFSEEDVRQDPGLIAQEADPSSRLTLSKRVRANVDVVLSQSLRDSSGLSAVVAYRPLPQLELRAVSRDSGNRSYALRHEVTFGGPARSTRTSAVAPRVSATVVTGVPEGDAAAVRQRLVLREGRPFRFDRWQDDVTLVGEWYRARGYLETRVRAERRLSADGLTVALAYRVTRGPRTTLVVEGLAVPSGLRRTLEEAWARSVFDQFLLDDLTRLVRRHLVDHDRLGGDVTARVDQRTDEDKRIRLDVSQGQPVRRRVVVFDGARVLSERTLLRTLAASGQGLDLWLDPSLASALLEPVYAAVGYLNAQVTADPPVVEGDTGLLRVHIDEGLQYQLASVRTTGVDDTRTAEVDAAFGLATGEVYRPAAAELARERVVELFHREGFHDVVVDVRPFVDRAAHAVNLTVAVTPGARHVLAGIDTRGTVRTSAGVVQGALQLHEGAPVDLREWARARKRLYDTNVFRQVDLAPTPAAPVQADGTQPVTATVTLTEWPAWTLRYGLQVNDDRPSDDPGGGVRVAAFSLGGRSVETALIGDLQNRNLFGRGIGGGVFTRVERDRRTTSTYLTLPALLGARLRTNAFAFTSQEDVPTGIGDLRLRRTGVSLEQRIREARLWEVVYGYRLERTHLFQLDADPQDIVIDARPLFGRFTGAAFLDRRRNPFNPTGGWFASTTLERVSEFESRTDFAKVLATHYRYQALGRILVAGAVRAGTSLLGEALLTERFFTGGGTTVRGYAEDSLGPVDRNGLAAGGASVLVLNGELRLPVYGWLKGVAFVDAGNVFAGRNPFRLSDLAIGAGAGLRLDSPFGLLRVDVAVPRGARAVTRGPRWYFGLGQVF